MKPEAGEANNQVATTIASGSRVEGGVSGRTPVRIEGELHGTVQVEADVAIARSGLLQGDVQARTVTVGGRLRGNVRGAERVEVLAGGSLEGDVTAVRFVIVEGAFYKGNVEMPGADKGRQSA